MNKREKNLCKIAEQDPDDTRANQAMHILRTYYDKTYGWCQDCDGLVTKEKNCCMNIKFCEECKKELSKCNCKIKIK